MNIQLRPALQRFVEAKVRAGEYASNEEVFEAGIARLMLDPRPELDDETLRAIEEAEAQGDRGEERAWEDLKAELVSKYVRR